MTFEHQGREKPVATDDEPEEERGSGVATAGQEGRPWIVVGLVFLALFVAILVWVVIRPVA